MPQDTGKQTPLVHLKDGKQISTIVLAHWMELLTSISKRHPKMLKELVKACRNPKYIMDTHTMVAPLRILNEGGLTISFNSAGEARIDDLICSVIELAIRNDGHDNWWVVSPIGTWPSY